LIPILSLSLSLSKPQTNFSFHSPLAPQTMQGLITHHSKEDAEFHFWGARNTLYYEELSDRLGGNEASLFEESFGAYSPTLWKGKTSKNDNHGDYESHPLLPHNHHYSTNLSPTSSRRAIAEGRRQLMEMIQDMPESCYELSLKDIVEEAAAIEDSGFHSKIKKQKKGRQMSRISSMDTETFLLKMFFPTCLSLKKKAKAGGDCSKVSPAPRPSSEGTKHDIDREWWMSRFFLGGENKRSRGNSMIGSTSSSRCLFNLKLIQKNRYLIFQTPRARFKQFFFFHAATRMPISYLVAGPSSTPRKTKPRDREDASWE